MNGWTGVESDRGTKKKPKAPKRRKAHQHPHLHSKLDPARCRPAHAPVRSSSGLLASYPATRHLDSTRILAIWGPEQPPAFASRFLPRIKFAGRLFRRNDPITRPIRGHGRCPGVDLIWLDGMSPRQHPRPAGARAPRTFGWLKRRHANGRKRNDCVLWGDGQPFLPAWQGGTGRRGQAGAGGSHLGGWLARSLRPLCFGVVGRPWIERE